MFQLNTFHLWSKGKIILFTKHMRIKSRFYNKNKKSFSINPFAPHSSRIRKISFEFEFVHLESGLFYLLLIFFYLLIFFALFFISFRFSFPLFSFYSFPSFLKSHRFVDPVESDPFSHRAKGTKSIRLIFRSKKSTMWNLRFFSSSSIPIPYV